MSIAEKVSFNICLEALESGDHSVSERKGPNKSADIDENVRSPSVKLDSEVVPEEDGQRNQSPDDGALDGDGSSVPLVAAVDEAEGSVGRLGAEPYDQKEHRGVSGSDGFERVIGEVALDREAGLSADGS